MGSTPIFSKGSPFKAAGILPSQTSSVTVVDMLIEKAEDPGHVLRMAVLVVGAFDLTPDPVWPGRYVDVTISAADEAMGVADAIKARGVLLDRRVEIVRTHDTGLKAMGKDIETTLRIWRRWDE